MYLQRTCWVVFAVVIVVTAAVPALRHQTALQLDSLRPAPPPEEIEPAPDLDSYRANASAFVTQHQPNDTEMLLAAGLLTDDPELLREAVEMGDSPAAHAAYVGRVFREGRGVTRLGNTRAGPADPESVAASQLSIEGSGSPSALDPDEGRRLLDALHSWQRADPENLLPVALEASVLHGLHQDEDALVAWAQAGRMQAAETYYWEHARSVYGLLTAMGMPAPEALRDTPLAISLPFLPTLRDLFRLANYEGQRAQVNANPIRAVTWWHSSIEVAQALRDSADFAIEYQVGVSLTELGAHNLWQFHLTDPQLLARRLYWGQYHELYLDAVGERRDVELRDDLLVGRTRSELVDEYLQGLGMYAGYLRVNRYLGLAAPAWALVVVLFLAFLCAGTWSRHAAYKAANLSPLWQSLLAVLVVLPIVMTGTIALRVELTPGTAMKGVAAGLYLGFIIIPILLALSAPLAAALLCRAPGASLSTAWRGNLRRVLPLAIALASLLALTYNLQAMGQRAAWVAKWTAPNVTEMAVLTSWLGERWTHPDIPLDAWRAEYPPSPTNP
ncbi:MAG: hypothetical protein JXA57_06465 [Armatimonadetes bacterium]|nr:hypothetical protein [Armatimonadota bacterium]